MSTLRAKSILSPPRFHRQYAWFVILSVMDLVLTHIVLSLGGTEVNAIADYVLQHGSLAGIVLYKVILVLLIISLCEWIGQHRQELGRSIAEWATGLTSIPVFSALIALGFHFTLPM